MEGSKAYSHFKTPFSSYCYSPMAMLQQLHAIKIRPRKSPEQKKTEYDRHSDATSITAGK